MFVVTRQHVSPLSSAAEGRPAIAALEFADPRLEYIAYLEEDVDFLEERLTIDDVLFSLLFAPMGS